ncbi:hypothetical protein TrVE_jg13627 [Triparma verrucosa]|uniref:Uncharacterized protein n=1 Tax=Triparma verrucosa TaxID=1606542 RepID=A0A9W7ELK3_9STRA|nr:hypothetical protein TrVE_jg13627 [Triparma verrucosa]
MKFFGLILALSAISPAAGHLRANLSPDAFAGELQRSLSQVRITDGICSSSEFVMTTSGQSGVTGCQVTCGKCATHSAGSSLQCQGVFQSATEVNDVTCTRNQQDGVPIPESIHRYTGCCANIGDHMVGEPSLSSCDLSCSSDQSTTDLESNLGTCVYYGKPLSNGPSIASAMANGTASCSTFCTETLGVRFAEYIDNGDTDEDKFSACCACDDNYDVDGDGVVDGTGTNTCYNAYKPGAGGEAYITGGGERLAVGRAFWGAITLGLMVWVW